MIYKTTKNQLIEARKRRLKRLKRGKDKDYYKQLVKEFKETKVLRERASKVL